MEENEHTMPNIFDRRNDGVVVVIVILYNASQSLIINSLGGNLTIL